MASSQDHGESARLADQANKGLGIGCCEKEVGVLAETKGTVMEVVITCRDNPLRAVKWVAPVACCFLAFCTQSVLLHIATIKYVGAHKTDDQFSVETLRDMGHAWLGHKDVSMGLLDVISGGAVVVFTVGTIWLRDLRLWSKVFFTASLLFVSKGILDCVTTLPDSIGWDKCESRLTQDGVKKFQELYELKGGKLFSELMKMELLGIQSSITGRSEWPVRYCADMIVSGHTFTMCLFLVASTDLARRLTLLSSGPAKWLVGTFLNILTLCCLLADLYLIVKNHFHYTVDVVLAVMLTVLFYTNSGVAIATNSWVEVGEGKNHMRSTEDNGMIWIPPWFIPFCCFHGYYEVREMSEDDVIERQRKNRSQVVERLHQFLKASPALPEAHGAADMQHLLPRDPGSLEGDLRGNFQEDLEGGAVTYGTEEGQSRASAAAPPLSGASA